MIKKKEGAARNMMDYDNRQEILNSMVIPTASTSAEAQGNIIWYLMRDEFRELSRTTGFADATDRGPMTCFGRMENVSDLPLT